MENTPVEEYRINNIPVLVKREDLFEVHPAPPLAKLRGIKVLLENLHKEGICKVAAFDTRVSKSGQGIAYYAKQLGMECTLGFPMIKGTTPSKSHQIAEQELEAKLIPMVAGRTAIVLSRFKKKIPNDCYLIPFGLVLPETVLAVQQVSIEETKNIKTIIVSTGTGTIATGVSLGTQAQVIGVSCGMNTKKQWNRIKQLLGEVNAPFLACNNLKLVHSGYTYYDAIDTSNIPFPTSPYYDGKAWEWLIKHIEELEQPIMFWNIGV